MIDIIKYPKIQTIWKREGGRPCCIVQGSYSRPEFESVNRWHVTEKIDGMNVRIIWDGERVEFRGRTDRAQMPQGLMEHLRAAFTADKMKNKFPGPAILFGEGYGAGIQKGGKYSQDQKFVLFDALIDGWWLEPENIEDIAGCLQIDSVPVLGTMDTMGAIDHVRRCHDIGNISRLAETPYVVPEGIVCRSVPTLFNRRGERVMWKLKVKDYQED